MYLIGVGFTSVTSLPLGLSPLDLAQSPLKLEPKRPRKLTFRKCVKKRVAGILLVLF